MSKETIQELLRKLQAALQDEEVDAETRALMATLDTDIQSFLSAPTVSENSGTLSETAQLLEARFAANHPTAERFLREMIDALVRMGI